MSVLYLVVPVAMYITLGLFVGGLSGLLGIGGGVILVPALMWLFGLSQAKAAGITLAVLTIPVMLPAVHRYYLSGIISREDFYVAGWLALGFCCGARIGASFLPHVSPEWLRFYFGLFLLYLAARFLFASDEAVTSAFQGVATLFLGYVGYWFLRALGRAYLNRPTLEENIRSAGQKAREEIDYTI